MIQGKKPKRYDLEERTLRFAREVIGLAGMLPNTAGNSEVVKQLIRSSGSVGANYIEGNEALSKKDFGMRVKICRKEAKESCYWLNLIEAKADDAEKKRQLLINEATEITKIFGAIVEKLK